MKHEYLIYILLHVHLLQVSKRLLFSIAMVQEVINPREYISTSLINNFLILYSIHLYIAHFWTYKAFISEMIDNYCW